MNKQNKELYSKIYYDDVVKRLPSFKGRENTIPPPELSENSTKELTKLILNFLKLNGHKAEEQKTVGKVIDKRKESIDVFGNKRIVGNLVRVKSEHKVGRADIGATIMIEMYDKIIPISVEIELKWQKDYQKKEQKKYQIDLESKGGLYFIIKTFDQFIEWYYEFINNYTMKENKQYTELSAEVKLRIVATHKETLQQFTSYMTNGEWLTFKKNSKYNYLAYQL